jgi:transketolase
METFGASAPASTLYEKFGFTSTNIVAAATKMLSIRSEGEK